MVRQGKAGYPTFLSRTLEGNQQKEGIVEMAKIKPMTKEELEVQRGIPAVYKKAIEHAIFEMSIPDEPEDAEWPDYFRGNVVDMELRCALPENAELDDHFYVTEAGWFQAGWKAKQNQQK